MEQSLGKYRERPWLKHYERGVPEKIDYEPVTLVDILERSVNHYTDNTALIFQGYKVTYREFEEMVNRFATCLHNFGVRKGDAVAILLPNLIPTVVAYYAVLRLGAITVMNNPLYSDYELEHQFNDSGAKVLITLDLLGDRMIDLRPKTKINQIVYTTIGDYLPFPKNLLFSLVGKLKKLKKDVKAAPHVYRWKECLSEYPPEPPEVKIGFDDVAMYQYTGGTTGISKGVCLTHGNLSKQTQQVASWFVGFQKGKDILLSALPYFHIFGLTTSMNFSIFMGWSQVLIPRPQPKELLEAIRNFRPTFAPLVPTMIIGMLDHADIKKTDMSCLNGVFSGAMALPVEIIRRFKELTGAVIVEGFGLTEGSPITHGNPINGIQKPGSVGMPFPDTECRIVDAEVGVVDMPVGQPGELIVQGPQVMAGYKDNPEETANALRGGWLYTGDIATMDEDGYFYIVDRKKDIIVSGGYKVYPREIDEVYYEHPKVKEVCAIGMPNPRKGECVKLFVVLKEGETATFDELIQFGRKKLAVYKLPVEIEFRTELPKSTVGKILRKELHAEELKKEA